MPDILFKKVKCKGYLAKYNNYISIIKNEDEEEFYTRNEETGREEKYEEGYKQQLRYVKEKNFEGICVGITKQAMSIWLEVEFDHPYYPPYIKAEKQDYIDVARIYYANNKSRLVPLNFIEKED